MKITIIGAGNGGQAMAGHFAILGHEITLYNRTLEKLTGVIEADGITLREAINGFGKLCAVTSDLEEAVSGANLIMITTTADAHKELASKLAPFVEENQVIVLNPGRTLGALEFSNEIKKHTNKRLYIAEAQSLIYACRVESPAVVRVIGVKDKVLLAAYPATDTDHVIEILNDIFPCFIKVENILVTSLENIGAIFHPAVVIFNAAAIERGEMFFFYNDMTPAIAQFLEQIDKERIAVGTAFGIKLNSVSEWVSLAYRNIEGNDLCEKMRNNPAYYQILAPKQLDTRLLTEDVPTGILPILELGKAAGLEMPLMTAICNLSGSILNKNFHITGRTLRNLGLENLSLQQIADLISGNQSDSD